MNKPILKPEIPDPLKTGIFDCDIHPTLKSAADIKKYLSKEWQDYFDNYGDFIRQPFSTSLGYPKATRALSRGDAWPPAGGAPGSDLGFLAEQHLDGNNIKLGVLQVLWPVGNKQRNADFAKAMCSAVNDWQIDEWISKEPRLKGSIVVPQEDAEAAVAEIERLGDHGGFAQILISPKSEEPLGRKRYWPIYEAAAAHNLPVTLHVGGVNGRPATGSGHPSYYAEEHQSHVQNMQALVASLIFEGVFEAFPTLRLIIVEAGLAWAPSLGWRMDVAFTRLHSEVPHLKKKPSEYLREHFWFSTQPADEPEKSQYLRDVFDWIGWDRILFASDYPHWDFDDPKYALNIKLSATEKMQIFWQNSQEAFGGPV